jgi:hypothetical protein
LKRFIFISLVALSYLFSASVLALKFAMLPAEYSSIKENETHKKRFCQFSLPRTQKKEKPIKIRSLGNRKLKGFDRNFAGIFNNGDKIISVGLPVVQLIFKGNTPVQTIPIDENRGPPVLV